MNVIPPNQRPVIPCPVTSLPHARRALADRLLRLREELANVQHRAIEVDLPEVADSLTLASHPIDDAAMSLDERMHAEVYGR